MQDPSVYKGLRVNLAHKSAGILFKIFLEAILNNNEWM